jgi:uncharacterized protein YjbJ (UPF0337 family)
LSVCAAPSAVVSGHVAITFDEMERAMNDDTMQGAWTQMKGKIRTQWGKLTDDDLEQIAGKREVLVGKLQERYGHAKERIAAEVDEFVQGFAAAHGTAKKPHTTDGKP